MDEFYPVDVELLHDAEAWNLGIELTSDMVRVTEAIRAEFTACAEHVLKGDTMTAAQHMLRVSRMAQELHRDLQGLATMGILFGMAAKNERMLADETADLQATDTVPFTE